MAVILVIDDERAVLDLASRSLGKDGHQAITMTDPLTAIDLVAKVKPRIDLLLADVCMTPISGFEAIKRIYEAGCTSPVLFMSGHSGVSAAIADKLGARTIIEKPFSPAQLRMAVQDVLDQSKCDLPMLVPNQV